MQPAVQTQLYESTSISPIRTTLYDLIEAVQDEVEPNEERMIADVVMHLLATGQVRFIRDFNVFDEKKVKPGGKS